MNNTEIVQIRLADGSLAYVEMQKTDDYEELGIFDEVFETSSEFIKVASELVGNIKKMPMKPSSIELELNVGLKMTSSGVLAWIVADSSGEAGIKVKMTWENNKE